MQEPILVAQLQARQCHDLLRVRRNLATREEWEDTLLAMLNEGAMLSDQDFPVLLSYLARNFKPQQQTREVFSFQSSVLSRTKTHARCSDWRREFD